MDYCRQVLLHIAGLIIVFLHLSQGFNVHRSKRLAGADPARVGQFPYLVALLHPEVRCTGSLISDKWILSAAHCAVVEAQVVKANDIVMVAGVVDFNEANTNTKQVRRGRSIHLHPSFEELKIAGADVALMMADSPFSMTKTVSTVKLSGEPFYINQDTDCVASGWGDTKESTTNSKLHTLKVVAVQSKSVCHGLNTKERRNMICLRNDGGAGLCDGDSGGPLICTGEAAQPADSRHLGRSPTTVTPSSHGEPTGLKPRLFQDISELVGVAHQVYIEKINYTSPRDMDCGSDTLVHTYMFTCPYLNWIRSFVPEVPAKPSKCFKLGILSKPQSDDIYYDEEYDDSS